MDTSQQSTMSETDGKSQDVDNAGANSAIKAASNLQNLTARREKPQCYFLKVVPLEVRIAIYRLCLVNPILGTAESITKASDGPYSAFKAVINRPEALRYNLSPQLLQTCRQICDEATSVLYKEDEFFAACVTPNFSINEEPDCAIISPLTRHWKDSYHPIMKSNYLSKETSSSFRKVRKWNIYLSMEKSVNEYNLRNEPAEGVVTLCQTICLAYPENVEVILEPPKTLGIFSSITSAPVRNDYRESVSHALNHFHLLRNIGIFTMRMGKSEDTVCRGYSDRRLDTTLEEAGMTRHRVEELARLVKGDTSANYMFLMFNQLLRYCQSFEFYEPFKLQMALTSEGLLDNLNNHIEVPQDMSFFPVVRNAMDPLIEGFDFENMLWFLTEARKCLETDSMISFIQLRKDIVERGTKYYNRIKARRQGLEEHCAPFLSSELEHIGGQKERQQKAAKEEMENIHVYLDIWSSSFPRYDMARSTAFDSSLEAKNRLRGIQYNLSHEKSLRLAVQHYHKGNKEGFFEAARSAYDELEERWQDIECATSELSIQAEGKRVLITKSRLIEHEETFGPSIFKPSGRKVLV